MLNAVPLLEIKPLPPKLASAKGKPFNPIVGLPLTPFAFVMLKPAPVVEILRLITPELLFLTTMPCDAFSNDDDTPLRNKEN